MRSYGNSSTYTLCFLWTYFFKHFGLKWTFCGPTFVRSSSFTRNFVGPFDLIKKWSSSFDCESFRPQLPWHFSTSLGTKDRKNNSNGISGSQFGSSMRIRFAWRSSITSVSCCLRILFPPSLGFLPIFFGLTYSSSRVGLYSQNFFHVSFDNHQRWNVTSLSQF